MIQGQIQPINDKDKVQQKQGKQIDLIPRPQKESQLNHGVKYGLCHTSLDHAQRNPKRYKNTGNHRH